MELRNSSTPKECFYTAPLFIHIFIPSRHLLQHPSLSPKTRNTNLPPSLLLLPPIPHMPPNNLRRRLRTMLSPNRLNKIALRIHQIKIDTMIDEIILALSDTLRRREVDAVFLADILDLLPGSRQADDGGVEFREVFE
jgi:hypothetical protein